MGAGVCFSLDMGFLLVRFVTALPGPIECGPGKKVDSDADDFGHHVVLRFGSGQIHEPNPLHGIFSL